MKTGKFAREINPKDAGYFADKSYEIEQQFRKKNLIILNNKKQNFSENQAS